jgi:hypothetical protein
MFLEDARNLTGFVGLHMNAANIVVDNHDAGVRGSRE